MKPGHDGVAGIIGELLVLLRIAQAQGKEPNVVAETAQVQLRQPEQLTRGLEHVEPSARALELDEQGEQADVRPDVHHLRAGRQLDAVAQIDAVDEDLPVQKVCLVLVPVRHALAIGQAVELVGGRRRRVPFIPLVHAS
jgi:hypothetical protein